jgi:hypothetical protein
MSESMSEFDKLTLQMFCNKSQYNKYLAKTDPQQYSENQEYLDKISHNHRKLSAMFSTLLENPEKQISTAVNESFDHFIKTCLQHFDYEQLAGPEKDSYENDDPSDTLFDKIDEVRPLRPSTSYWGKSVVKQPAALLPLYSMDAFARKKSNTKTI